MEVKKITYGVPERITPSAFAPEPLCEITKTSPEEMDGVEFYETSSGCVITVKVPSDTNYYGFGLQQRGFNQKGNRLHIKTNADTRTNNGNSHAPVPFCVTDKGFGVYVDSARFITFYCGREKKIKKTETLKRDVAVSEKELYSAKNESGEKYLVIEIPGAKGADVYYISGEKIVDIVSGYVLLSGGGAMPPLWGLGGFYRCCGRFDENQVLDIAKRMRSLGIPCDILGLEPGWQTKSYSCSFLWDEQGRFPNHKQTVDALIKDNFHINLWEHCFTHPTSPVFDELLPYSGDWLVWEGLVPDFTIDKAREIFASHQKKLIAEGITGFKLDECDGSDYTGGWFFPDCALFPSGVEGERYHNLLGVLYCKTMLEALDGQPTFSEVRALGALASSYPFVLYSDLYDQKDYLRATVNSGFSGLLWSPEVRHAENAEELIKRMQAAVFSVMALTNAWYLDEMPWETHGCEKEIKELLELRMSLVPYLYSAFYEYHTKGIPPVRALVCDFGDEFTKSCDDEYMFGPDMLVAPILYPEKKREVTLPEGKWFDFYTGEEKSGTFTAETDKMPVFVRDKAVVPFAEPLPFIKDDTVFRITLKCFGDTAEAYCYLTEQTPDGEYRRIKVTPDSEGQQGDTYFIV